MAEGAFGFRVATGGWWWKAFAIASALVALLAGSLAVLFSRGLGIWGINAPVGWGFAIVNFVWWIGIAHAGTLISAILLLLRQSWRTSVHRLAESMTVVAIGCAALFPLLHMGRPWLFYWLLPYPATTGAWPQFRSPLVWDFFAIVTYGTVSLLFWYVGLLPDLGILRDQARSRSARLAWAFAAMGWRGSARQWAAQRSACRLLAALATPLVISVHSVVSFDFAVSLIPGWHSTLLPPYFVAGAIFSGLAMLVLLAVPLRRLLRLEARITVDHLDKLAKLLLVSGLVVTYSYLAETFFAWYGANPFEPSALLNRFRGAYGPLGWVLMIANVAAIQTLWFGAVRRRPWLLFGVALAVSAGMWLERFLIVVVSLHRDYLPAAWGIYRPTPWDWATLLGSMGAFAWLLLLLLRFFPVVPVSGAAVAAGPPGDPVPGRTAPGGGSVAGLAAVFATPEELLEAVRRVREAGYRRLETASPRPVEGLLEALGEPAPELSRAMLSGGIFGAAAGLLTQYWTAAVDLPVLVGGKGIVSWQAFVPVTFECGVLGAAWAAVVALARATGLPAPHHPVFAIPGHERAGRDRFFLFVEAADGQFDLVQTSGFLAGLEPLEVHAVEG